jgi:Domain of unknown function (DUF6265)
MPRFCAFAVIAMLGSPVIAQSPATTSDLAFLTGCWRFERGGQTVEEHWLAPAGGSLFGVSRTVAGGKTVDFEFLQLRDLADGLTYIAKPSRQPEASFKMTTRTADEVVFENPQHDFPQRIRYRRSGDALHARIEGTVDGKPRAIDYPYVRVSCTP